MLKDFLEICGKILLWFLSRPTLQVRIQEDEPTREIGGLTFEVENISDEVTSLSTIVTANYFSLKREFFINTFDVREADRNLPPFTPKQFSASAREEQLQRGNGWFRTYVFTPTKGRSCRIRIRNAYLEQISFLRFYIERCLFRYTGYLIGGKTSTTAREYRARQRSKRPH